RAYPPAWASALALGPGRRQGGRVLAGDVDDLVPADGHEVQQQQQVYDRHRRRDGRVGPQRPPVALDAGLEDGLFLRRPLVRGRLRVLACLLQGLALLGQLLLDVAQILAAEARRGREEEEGARLVREDTEGGPFLRRELFQRLRLRVLGAFLLQPPALR